MLGAIGRLLLFRVLGARFVLALAVFGFIRRLLGGRRDAARNRDSYQPSQGESQIAQREPR